MNLKKQIANHVRDLPKSGIREFFDIVAQEKEVISLGVGEPDFDTPWHIREAAIYSLEHGRTHYTSNLGLLALRAAINPGDEVLYHEPCYVSYSPSVVMAHGVSVAIPTRAEDEFRLTAEALKAKIT